MKPSALPVAPALLLVLLASACAYWRAPGPPREYTTEEIIENVVTYLGVLLGEQPPTLNAYYAAEGPAPGLERELELASCSRELGVSIESQRVRATAGCVDWLSERRRNAEMEPSLYYAAVRRILEVKPEDLQIDQIAAPNQTDGYYRILVSEKEGATTLELYHAARPDLAGTSRLGLMRINGELVTDQLAADFEGWQR